MMAPVFTPRALGGRNDRLALVSGVGLPDLEVGAAAEHVAFVFPLEVDLILRRVASGEAPVLATVQEGTEQHPVRDVPCARAARRLPSTARHGSGGSDVDPMRI